VRSVEISWLIKWTKEHTFVRSGTTGPLYWTFNTRKQLYESYKQAASEQHFQVRSKSYLYYFSLKMKIKFLKYDRYLCPKCDELKHHKNLNKHKEHQTIIHNQSAHFKQLLSFISSKQCLTVQDYTTVHEDSQSKIRILNVTIYTKPSTQLDSKLQVQYYDYIGYIKCNYKYAQYIWDLVLEKLHLYQYSEGVFIWSDGTFKNKMNIYYFFQLQQKVQFKIECHYFASYRGHSICDRHFGVGKKKLRPVNRTSLVSSIEQVQETFQSLSNKTTYVIRIDEETLPQTPDGLRFSGQIRKFHEWQFTREGTVLCRECSGQGDFKTQNISFIEFQEQ
jgi:phage FluMu protein Com